MSLLVWLPLDGNLNNLGISNITITNSNNAVSSTGGKIGNCYTFNGTNLYLTLNNLNIDSLSELSITCWCCPTTTSLSGFFLVRQDALHQINLGPSTANCISYRDTANSSSTRTVNYGATIIANEWSHFAFVYKSGSWFIYLNGILVGSYTGSGSSKLKTGLNEIRIGRVQSTSGNLYYSGKLNDFRVYDYALSTFEVKEISQALVLHCKLDIIESNGVVYDSSGYGHNGLIVNSPTTVTDSPRYSSCVYINATNKKIKISNLLLASFSDSYTITWWGKSDTYSGKMHWGLQDGARLNGIYNGKLWNTGDSSNNPLYVPGTTTAVTVPTSNEWHHFAMVGDGNTCKAYQDGELWGLAKTYKSLSGTTIWINGWNSSTSYSYTNLYISDYRIYATALVDTDIKKLYNTGMSIDNYNNIHSYEFIENANNPELLAYWHSSAHNNHTDTGKWSNYNENGEWYLYGASKSFGTTYIPVFPTGKTYYYDMTISVSAGNQAYIGFCRFDSNHGSASNEGCIYIYQTKPTENIIKKRYFGTVNLGTTANGSNALTYITLRVLSGWSGSTNAATAEMTIHDISLREIDNTTGILTAIINKQGMIVSDEIRERIGGNVRFIKNGFTEAEKLIEW